MTAPGPKMVSHASGLRDCNANGSGGELTPGLSVEAELISSRLRTPGRSRFEHGRLQRPRLQPGDLENLRRAKTFLVNDPAAEQFRRVFRDVPRRQQVQILPDHYPFLQRQRSMFPVKIAGQSQTRQKIGRRHRVSADEDLRGHTLIGLEETDHITSRVAKSEPIEMACLR